VGHNSYPSVPILLIKERYDGILGIGKILFGGAGMGKYNFDEIVDRKGHNSIKWAGMDMNGNTYDEDVLPMWIADMDFRVADEILEGLRRPIDQGVLGYNYRPDSFYEAIIDWVGERYNWKIEKEWILFIPGIVPGLGIATRAYSKEGDGVLIQPPVYPPFYRVIENNRRVKVENQLFQNEDRYVMDLKDMEQKISENTKVALFCNPHNPVGRVWSKEELESYASICIEHGIIMVSDEIHCDLTFKGHKHTPLASISEETAMNTITFMAPSKTFNIPGLYASVAIIPNETLRKAFNHEIEVMEITHTNIFSVAGFEAAYRYGGEWLKEALVYVEDNADFAVDYIRKNIPEIKVLKPEGTFLLWLDFTGLGKSSKELSDLLLNKGKILLNDGATFGMGGEGFFRLNIGCPRKVLEEGLERIKMVIKY